MWNEVCAKVFSDLVDEFNKNNIRYFVFRNYAELPENNNGKDVDIIVQKKDFNSALKILKEVYKKNNLPYYDEAVFDNMYCTHGIGLENETGIHIDLLKGFKAKGYEIVSFEELYSNTVTYKNFKVLSYDYDSLMLFISKIFGQKRPVIKDKYRTIIKEAANNSKLFKDNILKFIGNKGGTVILKKIINDDFDYIESNSKYINKQLKKYCLKQHLFSSLKGYLHYCFQKFGRVVLRNKKHRRTLAVLAPDGTGKTTFLEMLQELIRYYYVNDKWEDRISLYHFRPNIFPNLGAVGEKAGVMKQDKDFTNPHRSKPANPISSLIRMNYYMADYILGWQKITKSDVRHDKYSVFDRYSYDFIVDPIRSKIGLPKFIRKCFVGLTPKPDIVFVLSADPTVVYKRKQELSLEEIKRQSNEYNKLTKNKRFKVINAENAPKEMAIVAMKTIMEHYCKY